MDYKWLFLALEGRVNRKVLWLNFVVPYFVIICVAGIIDGIAGTLGVFTTIVSVLMIWPSIAVQVKRCHDRGRTGWFILIGLVPLLNIWLLVELCFLKGTTGSNKYGEDPLGGQAASPEMADEAEEPAGPGSAEDQGEPSGS
jgi:uncharacterized membrane protein YhaH (DUF805 family)